MPPKIPSAKKLFFTQSLLGWYKPERRPMPWKGIKDPYKIWLSEIILQQTRVEQGRAYYERITAKYPDVKALARTTEEKFFKDWQGLGYYTRARNILHTAKHIMEELDGALPRTHDEWLKMKGVGEYTAAAISSFAFNEKRAVLDGNVFRVLARFFGIQISTDEPGNKKYFSALANELIDTKNPGRYNQAIMDFGAMVCTPLAAKCGDCPLKVSCYAFKQKAVYELPVRTKKLKSRDRFFNYFLISDGSHIILSKRNGSDIWKGLYEFPMIETPKPVTLASLKGKKEWKEIFNKEDKMKIISLPEIAQQLSHQKIYAKIYKIQWNKCVLSQHSTHYKKIQLKKINTLPFPKIFTSVIKALS
jgi:A/G-specific adenine glycosylase